MNSAFLLFGLLALATLGSKRKESEPITGDPTKDTITPQALGWGRIVYEGRRKPIQVLGYTVAVDYDFRVVIYGYKQDGSQLVVRTGDWDYRNPPSKIFNMAWQDYVNQGGVPNYNWKVDFDDNYYTYAEKDEKLKDILAFISILAPQLKTDIIAKIPPDIQETIEVIVNNRR